MAYTLKKPIVMRSEEVDETYKKVVGRFLFFKTEHWIKCRTDHVGNDIVIETKEPIRAVILNGKEIYTPTKE